jgi:hypothetical protein
MKKIMFSERFGLEQAVLAGTKTMTRRIIPDIEIDWNRRGRVTLPVSGFKHGVLFMDVRSILHDAGICDYSAPAKYQPKYEVGEEVAIAQPYKNDGVLTYNAYNEDGTAREDGLQRHKEMLESKGYRNKMFVKAEYMPHRIRITGIKAERLQDISDEDAMREGIRQSVVEYGDKKIVQWTYFREKITTWYDSPREAFAALIDRISGRGTWQRNPWVYAYTFELIK